MGTNTPAIIAVCASTVLAVAVIFGLTAAAQECVLGRERDVAIEIHALSEKVSGLEKEQAEFARALNEIRMNMVTQNDLDAVVTELLLGIRDDKDG
ncbi:MAG: hypothetical protein OXC25_07520 [Thiotrichales bacterium]|nr:hypothetical protein [Thiotrichales bacterium]